MSKPQKQVTVRVTKLPNETFDVKLIVAFLDTDVHALTFLPT
jgi:hypothetical protein